MGCKQRDPNAEQRNELPSGWTLPLYRVQLPGARCERYGSQ
jgi:hypothetical protein